MISATPATSTTMEATMREDFRVSYLRAQLQAAGEARRDRERLQRAMWTGAAIGTALSALLWIAGAI